MSNYMAPTSERLLIESPETRSTECYLVSSVHFAFRYGSTAHKMAHMIYFRTRPLP